jgi:ATP-dependent helicase/nuclease subunit A
MSSLEITPDLVAAQIAASDPNTSAWVSANAGSGKTHVLTQRVIRLLLDGVEPAKILCLTFTKAAAANMANGVFKTLAAWTALDDAALDEAIRRAEGRRPNAQRRLRARRLFAEALETPGGLKVQTIHAFCTGLLHQFPFEADVAARFEVLDERSEAETIDGIRLDVLLQAAGEPDSPLGRALQTAIVAAADTTFADVLREAIRQRDAIEGWVTRTGSVAAAITELSGRLAVAVDDTVERVEAEFLDSPFLAAGVWPVLKAALQAGSKSDREHVARLEKARAGTAWPNIEAYLHIFCTNELNPRKNPFTGAIRDADPDLHERLMQEQTRVCALLDRRRAIRLRDRSAALVTIADEVIRRYRTQKDRRGLLDYDDLIDKTLALLSAGSAAQWVMYKLDLGIDHVLIDEAQDTSPKQWEVIRRLTSEFTAGEGARGDTRRSIFAVGDEKQSIYSFQGAAPHRFDEMRTHYEREHEASGLNFTKQPLKYSFRSSPDVLGAVDKVFGREPAYRGLTTDPVATVHQAVRRTAPGCVDVWSLMQPDAKPEPDAWDAPFDAVSEHSPQTKLARRIAEHIRASIARGERVELTGARMRPGDVLVLVRQRGTLFEAIIRALKDAQVEVAGADRLVLTEHIAVMDLLSLADALLLLQHDLALAEVLKSPLFGLDDDELFALAWQRSGTLRQSLHAHAADNARFAATAAALEALADKAVRQSPFAFYAELLGAGQGRRKMLARLGAEAADALDEFLALALEYERRHVPSLQGFVAWMRAAPAEVKRDMDIVRDEVRVMTVHGAKGLEAPIVILADTTTPPRGPRDAPLLKLGVPGSDDDAGVPLVWVSAQRNDVACVTEARTRSRTAAEEEHRRLLYVAMTRAADRLIVCGYEGMQKKPEGCWYQLVQDALVSEAQELAEGDNKVWRWQKSQADPVADAAEPAQPQTVPANPPDWLNQPVAAGAHAPPVLMPSRAGAPRAVDEARKRALARGRIAHRLLQALPELAPERRTEAAELFLSGQPDIEADDRPALLRQTLALIEDAAFAPLFAPGSRAEVPIVGRVRTAAGVQPVSGQIDRLALTPAGVLIADFKTDRAAPARFADVPRYYVTQLALYRAVLARLYPGRVIRCALVWTQAPALMELPATALDAALSHLGVTPLDALPRAS